MVPGTGETFTILAGKGVICMTLFVGIDVSAKDFKVRVLNSTGEEPAKRFKAENNLPGSQSLIAYLLPICRQHHVSRLVFGLESTSLNNQTFFFVFLVLSQFFTLITLGHFFGKTMSTGRDVDLGYGK